MGSKNSKEFYRIQQHKDKLVPVGLRYSTQRRNSKLTPIPCWEESLPWLRGREEVPAGSRGQNLLATHLLESQGKLFIRSYLIDGTATAKPHRRP